jgi:antitoxin component HigA of HigAB toxin-antitoxin module
VLEFPLKKIRNDAQHERAEAMVSRLMRTKLDSGASEYLGALIILVNSYEDEQHCVEDWASPQDAMRAVMEANQLSQADIGRIIGSESAVSMFLKGSRGLSKVQIKLLSARFRIDPTVFMN